jgi:hypothetical protein
MQFRSLVVLFSLMIVVFILFIVVVFLPPFLADSAINRHGTLQQIAAIEPDKYALVVDEYRKTIAQVIGGLTACYFGYLAAYTTIQ